jgi:hypothetical protein
MNEQQLQQLERRQAFAGAARMRQAQMSQRLQERVARIRRVQDRGLLPIEPGSPLWAPIAGYAEAAGPLKVALALGGAASVREEALEAYELLGREFDLVVACNDIGQEWGGKFTHWCSLHPDKFHKWEMQRQANGLSGDYQVHFHRQDGARQHKITHDWGGSSGLLCVKVALECGAQRVICAGIPMTVSPHYHSSKNWRFATHHQRGWRAHLEQLRPFVRSMSGWTRDELGAPTKQWLGLVEAKGDDHASVQTETELRVA